jgi:ADP-ribosylation factor GTPase-activating protein 2/3
LDASYPEEVVITDVPEVVGISEGNTPAGEDDDFFSSWDKPAIKRPSNPPSRTGTPRAQSPFLKPGGVAGNGADRPKSPLVATETSTPAVVKPTVRKTTAGAAPKKNILGAKKKGLGAKKVVPADGGLDFDEAERKAKEEAERIEKLGYDPDAEAAETAATAKPKAAEASNIAAPTPVSPPRGGFGSTAKPDRWDADTERLGMGVARLGFGQVGAAKKAAPAKKVGGFGSVSKPVEDDSEKYARQKFGTQKGISSDEFFGRNNYDPAQSAQAKERLSGMSQLLNSVLCPDTNTSQALKVHLPFHRTHTSAAPRMTFLRMTTVILRAQPRTSSASLASLRAMTSRTCRTCLVKAQGSCRALFATT